MSRTCHTLRTALTIGLALTAWRLAPAAEPSIADLEKQFHDLPPAARLHTGPLFWLHGHESKDRLQQYVAKVAEGGNGCFTAESRPHSDWLGEGWFRDLGICLDAAKQHGLKMWIFDEKWWPSGEVAGKVPAQVRQQTPVRHRPRRRRPRALLRRGLRRPGLRRRDRRQANRRGPRRRQPR